MMTIWKHLREIVVSTSSGMNRKRKSRSRCGSPEGLEFRVLLTSWTGEWQWGPAPDAPPPAPPPDDPGPYDMHIDPDGLSTIEVPDIGNIPIKVKAKGDTLKFKGKSGDVRGKGRLVGGASDNRTPNDTTDASGPMSFSFTLPNGQKVNLNISVTVATPVPP